MTTRAFDIDTGFNSSTTPTAEEATSASETPTFGQVALKDSWYDHVDDINDVKAISASIRVDGMVVAIDGQILYQFDSDSAATADDDLILQPDSGSGRWHKVTSGGSAGVSGLSPELIEQSCTIRQQGIVTPKFDVSICEAFEDTAPTIEIFLLETASSGGSAMTTSVNPKFLDAANKNSQFEAGYAAVATTDAANINTEGTTIKIGTSATSWDKSGGTSVNSFIQHDLGAGNGISLAGNRQVLVYVNMPSTTNLSTISIRLSDEGDNPTNYAQFNASTEFDGTSFITGWNLVGFDLDGTKTTVGTGWSPGTNLLRTFAIGVVTSSAAQTYTNIVFDSLVFVADAGETVVPTYKQLLQPGMAYTITDTSNREQFVIDSASARVIGNITLSANLTNSFAGGTASVGMRSQLAIDGTNRSRFQSTSPFLGGTLSSGASNLTQDVRVSRTIKESLTNATIGTTIALDTEIFFEVIDTPTTTTATVVDTVNYSAQLLNGHKMHVVAVYENNGRKQYQYMSDITLTANSSHSSSVLTITASTGDITSVDTAIAAGGSAVLIKQGQLDAYLSCVAATANESYTQLTTPDEIIITDLGLPYPRLPSLFAHYFKTTPSQKTATFAGDNRRGPGVDLSATGAGALSFEREFKNGQFGIGGFQDSDYFAVGTTAAESDFLDPDAGTAQAISFSFWLYRTSTPGGTQAIMSKNNAASNGWEIQLTTSNTVVLFLVGGSGSVATSPVIALNTWTHIAGHIFDGTSTALYTNAVKTTGSGSTYVSNTTQKLHIGRGANTAGVALGAGYLADILLWSGSLGSAVITDAEVNAIYAGGRHRALGNSPGITYRYENTALSGQKLTVRVQAVRTTNAVEPFITRVAAIKTN